MSSLFRVRLRAAAAAAAVNIDAVQQHLPSNYFAELHGDEIIISGVDVAGWTLDGYVLPRLASESILASELTWD